MECHEGIFGDVEEELLCQHQEYYILPWPKGMIPEYLNDILWHEYSSSLKYDSVNGQYYCGWSTQKLKYLSIGNYQQYMVLPTALLYNCHGHLNDGRKRCRPCLRKKQEDLYKSLKGTDFAAPRRGQSTRRHMVCDTICH